MGRLPTEKTKPKTDLSQMIVLLYGPAKIGKSTWASTAPGAIFIPTEAGLGQLSVFSITTAGSDCCETWEDVQNGVDELLVHARETPASEDPYKTVIIDTVEELCDLAAEYVIDRHNRKAERKAEHISDIPYGKGYAALWREAKGTISKLARSRYGLVLIAHSYEITKEDPTGDYQVTVPSLSGKLRSQVEAMADLILFADTMTSADGKEERVLHTKPSRFFVAGDRTGKLPARLSLSFEAVAEALSDPVREWGVKVYQKACQHPGLKTKEAIMAALTSVVQVVTKQVGVDGVAFDLDFIRTLDDDTRASIEAMVNSEVDEAKASSQPSKGPDTPQEATEGPDPTDDTPEAEGPSEATEGPKNEEAKPKGKKKATKKATKKPDPQPEEGDVDDSQEDSQEATQEEGTEDSDPFSTF